MTAYYNEFDPYAAQWLRNLIAAGHIAPGDVDERSIVDVQADDLKGYTQCHFFAGIGGWSLAARLAGWPDDRELWTGSCPCQPFSVAGKQAGQSDERHLWPTFANLIAAQRPCVVMGEQVAAAVGKHWLDGVHSDLEGIGYRVGAAVVPACAVDAPHRRDRLWFVADADQSGESQGWEQRGGELGGAGGDTGDSFVANAGSGRRAGSGEGQGQQPRRAEAIGASESPLADASRLGGGAGLRQGDQIQNGDGVASRGSPRRSSTAWSGAEWLTGADGKARRFEPSIRLLAHGVPARVGKLRAYGNAIVPQVAAEIIGAYLDCQPA